MTTDNTDNDINEQGAPDEPVAPADEAGATGPEGVAEVPDELGRVAAERDEYLDQLQRTRADFDNYRKRVERERPLLQEAGIRDVVGELLPVLDNLERALEAAVQHEEAKLEEGVRLVHRALADVLAREGLVEVETDGAFDPHTQEALLAQPSDAAEGTVIQVLQKGYRLGERVLRPARVVVSSGAEGDA